MGTVAGHPLLDNQSRALRLPLESSYLGTKGNQGQCAHCAAVPEYQREGGYQRSEGFTRRV
ncbi:hypothetical protein JZ751_014281 [Albula glossodonta]|uniref:Uncharacterized protein n=1 Tax=Albula glossodonta TaxID=121402 RepID=A0A8T2NVK0_9TELE|nr:hypothetical protein JZ751_014281 [Albula glossodonta]